MITPDLPRHRPSWPELALCKDDREFSDREVAEQIVVCRGCPVRLECLEYGLATAPSLVRDAVVHGGLTPTQLVRRARQRRKAS